MHSIRCLFDIHNWALFTSDIYNTVYKCQRCGEETKKPSRVFPDHEEQ